MTEQTEQPLIQYHVNMHRFAFKTVPRCPTCQKPLLFHSLVQDQFPYTHADLCLYCILCDEKYVFGIAIDKSFGLELIIWDSHPDKVLEQAQSREQPICPFHIQTMQLTKIWGDLLMADQAYLKIQWKCPHCFLTAHKDIVRFEPGTRDTTSLGPHAQLREQQIRAKLEAMGYL